MKVNVGILLKERKVPSVNLTPVHFIYFKRVGNGKQSIYTVSSPNLLNKRA